MQYYAHYLTVVSDARYADLAYAKTYALPGVALETIKFEVARFRLFYHGVNLDV